MLLKGKNALITGAGQGIGKTIALTYAQHGANVCVCDISEESVMQTAEEIRGLGVEALGLKADVSSMADAQAVTDKMIDTFGKMDILVANAGITRDGLMLKMTPEDWELVLRINLTGAFNFIKAAYRPMMKQRSGRIIGMASVIGLMGNAGQANYAASKAGLIGLLKSVAKELAARGVTANAIAPGYIRTKMTDVLSDEVKSQILSRVPMGELGTAQNVADTALFLASDMASYITGQVIPVDGGMVI